VTVLSDSSPLITLAKIGRLDLLPKLYEKVTITPEVYAEVVVSGAGLAGSSQIFAAKWIDVKPVQKPADLADAQQRPRNKDWRYWAVWVSSMMLSA
jgi:predicted nucleic acid-binding protein